MSNGTRVNGNGNGQYHNLMYKAWYDALRDINVSESKAKLVANLHAEGVLDNMEISKNFNLLTQKVDNLDKNINQKVDNLGDTLNQKVDNLGENLNPKIDNLGDTLNQKIDNLDEKFSQKIDHLDEKFSQKIDHLDEKFSEKLASVGKQLEASDKRNNLQFTITFGVLLLVLTAIIGAVAADFIMKLFGG